MNRFAFHRPTCPFSGLPIVPIGSKVMADCHVTHHTSPCFFWWAYILYDILYSIILSCYTTKMMFLLFPPPEWVVPIDGIIATDNGRICNVHRFACRNSLLLATPARGCGVLLCLKQTTAVNELAAYFVLCDGSDGCLVCFTPKDHAVGAIGQILT